MDDLDKLIEAVEAGEAGWNRLATIAEEAMLPREAALSATAYSGSLDAALRLHEALLPGWFSTITRLCGEFDGDTKTLTPTDWRAEVSDGWRGRPDDDDPEDHFQSADDAVPARAWLLAILRAVKAQQSPGGGA